MHARVSPILFHVPRWGVAVPAYEFCIVLAVVVGQVVGPRLAARLEGLDASRVRWALLVLAVPAVAGARLHFLAVSGRLPSLLSDPLEIVRLEGGMHAPGAFIAILLTVPLAARWIGVSVGRLADALTPTVALGIAIARVGCFLAGCCYGKPCTWPWCFTLHTLVPPAAVHPFPLYLASGAILIGAYSLASYRAPHRPGAVALRALFAFAALSAGLEVLRADYFSRVYWGPLPQLTWMSAAVAALAGATLLAQRRRVA